MPLLDLFWTMLLVFSWVLWFWLLFRVYGDLFARDDIGGWAKTGWVLATLLLPFLGVFTYLVSQGRAMEERAARRLRPPPDLVDPSPRLWGTGGDVDEQARARELLQRGALTEEEYRRLVPSPRP
ncbi:SHOCT domain-containing protein [Geodermatophilus sp. SYSU D00691]